MTTVIAVFKAPKQRITREYQIVLIEDKTKSEDVRFSVHRAYLDDLGGLSDGSYNLNAVEGWEVFKRRVDDAFQYGPGTWDERS